MKELRQDNIQILDAHENNLKHIDVTIPKGELVVFAGTPEGLIIEPRSKTGKYLKEAL